MAAKHCADIKPTGVNQKELVELLYQIGAAINGITTKLDADGGVTDTNYKALCYLGSYDWVRVVNANFDAIGAISDGTRFAWTISPNGIRDDALLMFMYSTYNALTTMCQKLDADAGVTDTTYNALCYVAKCLHQVTYDNHNYLGNGTSYYFRPGGVLNWDAFCNWLYGVLDAINTLTAKLDLDGGAGGVADTNYNALWYTAAITYTVEDSKGNRLGN